MSTEKNALLSNPFTNGSEKLKSYWNRPGGKFGTIIGLGALGVLLYKALPHINSFMELAVNILDNTLYFGLSLGAIFLLLMALKNKKLRLSVFYLYEILMKKLVGIVIQLDPFIIAEDYINDMKKERERLKSKNTELLTQKEKLDLKIKENQDHIAKQMRIAEAAKKTSDTLSLALSGRQIERLNTYNRNLAPLRDNLEKVSTYLTKIYKQSEFTIQDAEAELTLKKDQYEAVLTANGALKSAMSIFSGDPEKKLLVQQSMEYVKDSIASNLAEMKQSIDITSDFMRSIDLENATFEVQGLEYLESYSMSKKLVTQATNIGKLETIPANAVIINEYSDLLK